MGEVAFVEEALKKIQGHKGVRGIIVINGDGIPIRSTVESAEAIQYAAHVSQLTERARSAVKNLNIHTGDDADDDLLVMRLRSKKHEVIVTPTFDAGHEFSVIVIQEPSAN